jgi:hypothetical protein
VDALAQEASVTTYFTVRPLTPSWSGDEPTSKHLAEVVQDRHPDRPERHAGEPASLWGGVYHRRAVVMGVVVQHADGSEV